MSPSLPGFALGNFAMRAPIYVHIKLIWNSSDADIYVGSYATRPADRTKNRHHTSELGVTPSPYMLTAFLFDCFLCFHPMPLSFTSRPHSLHISIYDLLSRCSNRAVHTVYARRFGLM